jgi:hypothetical protein
MDSVASGVAAVPRGPARHMYRVVALGHVVVLLHFAYRAYLVATACDAGLGASNWTPAWLAVHAALHVMELAAWPSVQDMHSMILAFRSIAMIGLMFLHVKGAIRGYTLNAMRPIVLVATMMMVDCAGLFMKTHVRSRLPRTDHLRTRPQTMYARAHEGFYRVSHVVGSLHILTAQTMGPVFMMLIPIQVAQLCTTLVARGRMGPRGWHICYTAALLVNYAHGAIVKDAYSFIPAASYWNAVALMCIGRIVVKTDKYVLWSIVIMRFTAFYFPERVRV